MTDRVRRFVPVIAGLAVVALTLVVVGPSDPGRNARKPRGGRFDAALIREHHGRAPNDEFGTALAGLGDLDGDGRADYAIAAVWDGTVHPDGGSVVVFSGARGTERFRVDGQGPGWAFGSSLAGGGDLNGDGVRDLVVGAVGAGGALPDAEPPGVVVALSGSDGRKLWTATGPTPGGRTGFSTAAVGDVDGDAVPDFVVGSPGSWKKDVVGSAEVISGATGRTLHRFTGPGEVGDRFGFAVSGVGDLDGDGVPEVLVGCLGASSNGPHCGAIYIYSGASGALVRRHDGEEPAKELGHAVANAGDIDGDGVEDILAGSHSQWGNGFARVYSGRDGSVLFHVDGSRYADTFGHTLASAGDMDGDGVPDLAVGAPGAVVGGLDKVGFVRVYSGRTGGLLLERQGPREFGVLAYWLAGVGDVDGDGRADLLVGSNAHNGGVGFAHLVHLPRR